MYAPDITMRKSSEWGAVREQAGKRKHQNRRAVLKT
jgi:hypothetical protein